MALGARLFVVHELKRWKEIYYLVLDSQVVIIEDM